MVFFCSIIGIIYMGEMSIEDMYVCIKYSNVLVNMFESEGMVVVVLEVVDFKICFYILFYVIVRIF